MTRSKATAIGFTAILMWSLLALFTIGIGPGAALPAERAVLWHRRRDRAGLDGAQRGLACCAACQWKVYAFGTVGLFGYHFLYFTAFRIAPTAETGLIAYLWPLFIVLFSGLLPGETADRQPYPRRAAWPLPGRR